MTMKEDYGYWFRLVYIFMQDFFMQHYGLYFRLILSTKWPHSSHMSSNVERNQGYVIWSSKHTSGDCYENLEDLFWDTLRDFKWFYFMKIKNWSSNGIGYLLKATQLSSWAVRSKQNWTMEVKQNPEKFISIFDLSLTSCVALLPMAMIFGILRLSQAKMSYL